MITYSMKKIRIPRKHKKCLKKNNPHLVVCDKTVRMIYHIANQSLRGHQIYLEEISKANDIAGLYKFLAPSYPRLIK